MSKTRRKQRSAPITQATRLQRTPAWIWALRPLELDHTPNMYVVTISTGPGRIVQTVQNTRHGGLVLAERCPREEGWVIGPRYYRPTSQDLAIVTQAYPEATEPGNVNWLMVARDLAAAVPDPVGLRTLTAPQLLALLDRPRPLDAAKNNTPPQICQQTAEAKHEPPACNAQPLSARQERVLKALEGVSLTSGELSAKERTGINKRDLYKKNKRKGILTELMDRGLVKKAGRRGYYRPDAPPLGFPGTVFTSLSKRPSGKDHR